MSNTAFREHLQRTPGYIEVTKKDFNNLCQAYDEACAKGDEVFFFKYENDKEEVELYTKQVKETIAFYKTVYDLETKNYPVKITIKI